MLFSFFTGIIWRVEIEIRGWEGLLWLRYFHLAVPAGVICMALWIFLCREFYYSKAYTVIRSVTILLFYILCGFFLLIPTVWLLSLLFSRGPRAFIYMMNILSFLGRIGIPEFFLKAKNFPVVYYLAWFIWFMYPFFFFLVARIMKFKTTIYHLILSESIFILAGPVAILLLKIVSHRGGSDYINAIKSGFIIPFLFFAIGINFCQFKTPPRLFKKR